MGNSTQTILNVGTDGILINAECSITNGLPSVVLVGLGGKAVEEAKERIRSAFSGSGLDFPRKRVTINLAPADVPKEGSSLDLAIATAILVASKKTNREIKKTEAFIGELGLDGTIRPVRGIIGKLIAGKKLGVTQYFVPEQNVSQAELIAGITLIPLKRLDQLYRGLNGDPDAFTSIDTDLRKTSNQLKALPTTSQQSLHEIVGQDQAKRAIEIAAAGGHNILLNGPPGTGKTMLARALASILPRLSQQEILEVTHLHSLNSPDYDKLVTERPFRAPHHSASHTAIVGGGHNLRPGEISLSHRGVLFFDEFPEFNRSSIEALRQPLEDRQITVTRIKHTATYPADFIFVATSNPCPCGFYGTKKACRCSAHEVGRYRKKISGPIIDRIDLYVNVDQVEIIQLLPREIAKAPSSNLVRDRVSKARIMQKTRSGSSTKLNAHMTNEDLAHTAKLGLLAKNILDEAAKKIGISARSYFKVIKVARTIADLEGSEQIETEHIAEALQYRKQAPEID